MESLLELAATQPTRTLAAGEVLIAQGREGGDLFVLESGQLVVERDGVAIATISSPSAVVGEMSVVLGTLNSATVKADRITTVRVIQDARKYLEQDQAMTFRLARLMATRSPLIPSGITTSILYPLTAATIERALPVLPLVASTMVSPSCSSPSPSARSIMYFAILALMDPDGFKYSSLQ